MVYRTPEEIRQEKASEAGQQLNAARKRSQKSCPICLKDFSARAGQKYCSTNCRVKAHYKRSRLVT